MLAVCDGVTNWTLRAHGVVVGESVGSWSMGRMILK